VRERFGHSLIHLDTAEIEANIEHTRFPVPDEEQHEPTDDFPGLVRAADLIGQLADINYLRKTAALFSEFREIGMSNKLKYNSAADLRANYPDFFWRMVQPYTADALRSSGYTRRAAVGREFVRERVLNGTQRSKDLTQALQCGCGAATLFARQRDWENALPRHDAGLGLVLTRANCRR
jgi:hypothetical protein